MLPLGSDCMPPWVRESRSRGWVEGTDERRAVPSRRSVIARELPALGVVEQRQRVVGLGPRVVLEREARAGAEEKSERLPPSRQSTRPVARETL